ncbi:hypothetical protein KIL84_021320 [Mauremys mutica]|uniref:Uncharacterized protein n=1 Tax=Mauremys mutica TaxID=74926 RepID=A0A9D3XBC4_9SAUR|nr:hypothetical protein KIL84_021320 [Mauremys mutica]
MVYEKWMLFQISVGFLFSGNKEQLLLKNYSRTCAYFHCCVAVLIKHLFLLLLMSLHNCLQTNLTRNSPRYFPVHVFMGENNKYLLLVTYLDEILSRNPNTG